MKIPPAILHSTIPAYGVAAEAEAYDALERLHTMQKAWGRIAEARTATAILAAIVADNIRIADLERENERLRKLIGGPR